MNTTEEIQQLEQRLREAMLTSHLDELDALLSDTLLFVGPDGQLMGKVDDLAAHRAGAVRFQSMEALESTIQLLDDVAIVFALMALEVMVQEQLVTGHYRYTRVWHRHASGWQITAGHVSAVPG